MGWLGGIAGAFGGAGDYFQKERDRKDALAQSLANVAGDIHDPEQLAAMAKTMGFEDRHIEDLDLNALAGIGMPRETQRLGALHSELGGLEEGHQIFQEDADIGHILDKYDLGEVGKFGVERRPGAMWAIGETEHHPGVRDAIGRRKAGFETAREGRVREAGETAGSTQKGQDMAEEDTYKRRFGNEEVMAAIEGVNRAAKRGEAIGAGEGGLQVWADDFKTEGNNMISGWKQAMERAGIQSDLYRSARQPTQFQRFQFVDPDETSPTYGLPIWGFYNPETGEFSDDASGIPRQAPENPLPYEIGNRLNQNPSESLFRDESTMTEEEIAARRLWLQRMLQTPQ